MEAHIWMDSVEEHVTVLEFRGLDKDRVWFEWSQEKTLPFPSNIVLSHIEYVSKV